MKLQRINMLTPNNQPNNRKIYAPSRLASIEIDYQEFVTKYADHPRPVLVSFEPDRESNPQQLTAYSFGLSGWFIIQ